MVQKRLSTLAFILPIILKIMEKEAITNDKQLTKKDGNNTEPLKPDNTSINPEKSAAEIEKRVMYFGQKYIDRLMKLTKDRVGGIREDDPETSNVDTFVLFGNPDLDFITNFAQTWKKIASEGKNQKIVLAGGIGRGTPPLIEKKTEGSRLHS